MKNRLKLIKKLIKWWWMNFAFIYSRKAIRSRSFDKGYSPFIVIYFIYAFRLCVALNNELPSTIFF